MRNTVISSATASCGSWNAPCPSRCARPKPSPRCAPTSKYYTEHIDAHTRPYDGIPELIAELARRGVALAVASNKFQAGTEKLVGLFFPGVTFAAVLGQRPGVPLKPSPAVVEEILARTGTAREEVLYGGDSGVDIETAAAAGVRSAGVTWGFRDRAELIAAGARHLVDRPGELLELL